MLKSIRDVQTALLKGNTDVSKLCNHAYKTLEENTHLNAFITTKPKEDTLQEATKLDEKVRLNAENPLYGVPVSIKDNFCTDGILTTCGSKMLHDFIPPYNASVVEKLRQANCLIMGKTNMDEFAMGSSCTTSFFKPTLNSWGTPKLPASNITQNDWYMAGGSSTGSAVSVSCGACFASIGTDTGGSTRQPASLTGIVGFKPTYGLISRFGLVPLCHSLDVVGILARNAEDAELVFNQLIGQDENDLTSVDYRIKLKQRLGNTLGDQTIRVGLPRNFISKGDLASDVSQQYDKAIKSLSGKTIESTRFEMVEIDLPHSNLSTECYTILSSSEIASNMSCFDGVKYGLSVDATKYMEGTKFNRDQYYMANKDAGFGPEVKKRILLGNYFLLAHNIEKYLKQAQRVRRLINDDFQNVFEHNKECHVMLLPSTPTTSISYAEWLAKQDDNKLFREDYYLIPANLANIPSISLPSGLSPATGLPIGLQLVANKFHDRDLLEISKFLEKYVFESSAR